MADGERAVAAWPPLESNPEIFTAVLNELSGSGLFECFDLVSYDTADLTYVPAGNVVAVLLLFPLAPWHKFTEPPHSNVTPPEDLYFLQQKVNNACGMVALMHALANNRPLVQPSSIMAEFLTKTRQMSPEERGFAMASSEALERLQRKAAGRGQSQFIEATESVKTHFVCFVKGSDGNLYELDGRLNWPVCHGPIDGPDGFLAAALKQCEGFSERDELIGKPAILYGAIAVCAIQQ